MLNVTKIIGFGKELRKLSCIYVYKEFFFLRLICKHLFYDFSIHFSAAKHVNMAFWNLKRNFSFGIDHLFKSFGNDEEDNKGDDYSWLFGDKEDGKEYVISDDDLNCKELISKFKKRNILKLTLRASLNRFTFPALLRRYTPLLRYIYGIITTIYGIKLFPLVESVVVDECYWLSKQSN